MNRTMISLIMAFLAILWLVFSGIQDASLVFYFPTEVEQSIISDEMEQDARIRIGGFVQPDSISIEEKVLEALKSNVLLSKTKSASKIYLH